MFGKVELVNKVAEKASVSKASVDTVLNTLIDVISAELVAGEEVAIRNFVTFKSVEKPEHQARNPHSGATVTVPAKKVVKVKVAKAFTNALN